MITTSEVSLEHEPGSQRTVLHNYTAHADCVFPSNILKEGLCVSLMNMFLRGLNNQFENTDMLCCFL